MLEEVISSDFHWAFDPLAFSVLCGQIHDLYEFLDYRVVADIDVASIRFYCTPRVHYHALAEMNVTTQLCLVANYCLRRLGIRVFCRRAYSLGAPQILG